MARWIRSGPVHTARQATESLKRLKSGDRKDRPRASQVIGASVNKVTVPEECGWNTFLEGSKESGAEAELESLDRSEFLGTRWKTGGESPVAQLLEATLIMWRSGSSTPQTMGIKLKLV